MLIRAYHYSKSCSKTGLSWTASDRYGNTVAAAVFLPPLPPSSKSVAQLAEQHGRVCVWQRVLSLHRLVVVPGQPQNVASMLVCKALRDLRKSNRWDAVVTYADTSAGHTGQVYRAMNAEYVGVTAAEPYWVDENGMRVSRKSTKSRAFDEMHALGLKKQYSAGKHKFVWWLNKGRAAKEGEE